MYETLTVEDNAQVCALCMFWTNPNATQDQLDDDSSARDPWRFVYIKDRGQEIFGACLCPKFVTGYGVTFGEPDEIVIEDDEGWGFYTGPLFGCVHFVRKSPIEPPIRSGI